MSEKKPFQRVRQLTGSYCGPAVMQMLLSPLGMLLNQEEFVDACGARNTVMKVGLPLNELAVGLKKSFPKAKLWVKSDSSVDDIQALIEAGYPVGVDWQGVFTRDEYGDDETDKWAEFWDKVTKAPVLEGDQGHYCVMLEVNKKKGYLRFADPYGHYAGKDRFIAIWEFEERWWDDRIDRDPVTGKKKYVLENKLIFIVTAKGDKTPEKFGMTAL